jgi:ribosomal protein S18 acetylase RimI-like enzyme
MKTVTIRSFRTADTEQVVGLWQKCGLAHPNNNSNKDIERKLQHSARQFFVAEIENAIVGSVMAGYEGHRGWINYLGVLPEYQMTGIGRKLMEKAENVLREMGCPKINLQIRRTNLKAIHFYSRIGFIEDDVISMGKRLIKD